MMGFWQCPKPKEESVSKNLYVGNLPWTTTEEDLKKLFSDYDDVEEVRVMTDRDTGRSRGFGFVNFASDEEADRAIKDLNGHTLDSREITVNEARPKRDRNSGGSFGSSRW